MPINVVVRPPASHDRRTPDVVGAPRMPPRLTRSVFRDLAVWMVGLGLMPGVAFPPMVLLLGVADARAALTPRFFAACVAAGLMVGGVNFALSRTVIGSRLR